jgi:hypothetical protein
MSWTRLADIEREYKILERDLAFIDLRVDGQLIVRINEHTEVSTSPAKSPAAPEEITLPNLSEQREI